jgi:hypothetical protein
VGTLIYIYFCARILARGLEFNSHKWYIAHFLIYSTKEGRGGGGLVFYSWTLPRWRMNSLARIGTRQSVIKDRMASPSRWTTGKTNVVGSFFLLFVVRGAVGLFPVSVVGVDFFFAFGILTLSDAVGPACDLVLRLSNSSVSTIVH